MSFIPIEARRQEKIGDFFVTPSVGFLEPYGCAQRGYRQMIVSKAPLFDQGLRKRPWARSVKNFRLTRSFRRNIGHTMSWSGKIRGPTKLEAVIRQLPKAGARFCWPFFTWPSAVVAVWAGSPPPERTIRVGRGGAAGAALKGRAPSCKRRSRVRWP
jgi:hypothetical protein